MRTISGPIEWAVAGLVAPGETESGDLHAVVPFDHGALVAVVDGLGHGFEAHAAAKIAVQTLHRHAHEPVSALLRRCHEALQDNVRGAVMSLASFDGREARVTWAGVGNVEGVLLRVDAAANPPRRSLVPAGGVLGSRLPTVQPVTHPVNAGDLLVFATDGVAEDFIGEVPIGSAADQAAKQVIDRFGKGTDDALVLVARYVGAEFSGGAPGKGGRSTKL